MGATFAWTGGVAGSWDVASNWQDVTTGTPASVPPGANDSVTISQANGNAVQVITGTGASASLTILGPADLVGQFTTGSLDFEAGSTQTRPPLMLGTGDSLAVTGAATIGYPDVIEANGGTFTVAGTVTELAYGNIEVTDSGVVQIGWLVNTAGSGGISVDASSQVEIGSADDAVTGEIVVDAGAGISGPSSYANEYSAPTIVNNGTISGAFSLDASNTLDNNGMISGASSEYANSVSASSIVNDGTISDIGKMNLSGSVSGTGQIDVGDASVLTVSGQIAAGNTINLVGAGHALNISSSIAASIAGFGSTDAIIVQGTVTNASYSGDATGGALNLIDQSTTIATLNLVGDYTGETFLTVPIDGGSQTQIALFPASVTFQTDGLSVAPKDGATALLAQLFADPYIVPGGTIDTLAVDGGGGTLAASGPFVIHDFLLDTGADLLLQSAALTTDPVTIDAGGNLSGSGKATGAVTNNGTISASGGTLELTDSVTGAGVLQLASGSTLQLDAALGTGPQIVFDAGSPETLILGTPGSSLANGIAGLVQGDRIEFGGGMTITAVSMLNANTAEVSFNGTGGGSGTYDLSNVGFGSGAKAFTFGVDTASGDSYIQVACFAAGTRFRVGARDVPVEELRIGDPVQALFAGAAVPIKWIGHRRVDCRRHPRPQEVWPVRVSAHALAPASRIGTCGFRRIMPCSSMGC